MTDKYWLCAVIPGAEQLAQGRFLSIGSLSRVETLSPLITVAQGKSLESTSHFFAGAKQLALLDRYQVQHKISHFDLAVDFGWFYFLTKPMFYLLSWLKEICGNFGYAIIVMTVLVKMAFLPLAFRSHRAMAAMKKMQPQIQALKERFSQDKTRMQEEMVKLYKNSRINPASGCLPMIVQIPVFFALYKVLFISIEMRHTGFLGWITDLSAPDPTTIFNFFGLMPFAVPAFLHIGAWPILMGISMLLQQRVAGAPALDPAQKIMFTYVMPVVFSYMLSNFPVGLVIYWTWSNVLTILQQLVIARYAAHSS